MTTLAQAVQAVDEARSGLVAAIRNKGVTIDDNATLNDCRVGVQNIQAGGDVQGLVFNDIRFTATEAKVVPQDFFVGKISAYQMFYQAYKLKRLPFFDTSTLTSFWFFASECWELIEVPEYDTRQVTDFSKGFMNCKKLKNIPHLSTSRGSNFSACFYQTPIETTPDWDFSNGQTFTQAFSNCKQLLSARLSLLKGDTFWEMFTSSGLKSAEFLDMENGPGYGYRGMFRNCIDLTSITGLGFGVGGNDYTDMFQSDAALVDLTIAGNIKRFGRNQNTFIDFSPCVALSHDSLMNIVNALEAGTEHAPSLKLGATNEAKLTPEELQQITNKGWILAQ